jgi:hypothetical protein
VPDPSSFAQPAEIIVTSIMLAMTAPAERFRIPSPPLWTTRSGWLAKSRLSSHKRIGPATQVGRTGPTNQ